MQPVQRLQNKIPEPTGRSRRVRLDDEFLVEDPQGFVKPVGGSVVPGVEHPA